MRRFIASSFRAARRRPPATTSKSPSSPKGITVRFCRRPRRRMLAAKAAIDVRALRRTLRLDGRARSRESGTSTMLCAGTAASRVESSGVSTIFMIELLSHVGTLENKTGKKRKPELDSGRGSVHRRSPWVLGSAGAAKPFRGHRGRLGPARVRRQGRTAKALARPAGEAEDTGAAAALDGRSARRGQASRTQRRAGGGHRHRRVDSEGRLASVASQRHTRSAHAIGKTKEGRSPLAYISSCSAIE
ncbi:hypothetical protein D3C87_1430120 [compost metagenome]